MPIMLDIVTVERVVYSKEVNSIVAPGAAGTLGVLPNHAPLMTSLVAGEIRIDEDGEEIMLAISGGFLEIRPDSKVIVLADSAERDDEIDLTRAEEAKRRAEERLSQSTTDADRMRAEASLQRSIIRLRVGVQRRRQGPPTM